MAMWALPRPVARERSSESKPLSRDDLYEDDLLK
jgi:hypothetical protein